MKMKRCKRHAGRRVERRGIKYHMSECSGRLIVFNSEGPPNRHGPVSRAVPGDAEFLIKISLAARC